MITVPYRTGGPLADIYTPPEPTGASVLLVHGGGFVIGSRRMTPMRFLAQRFVAAGITVCSIDYRLGLRLDHAVDDVRAALAFWQQRAPRAEAVSIVGLSAGATLAQYAAPQAARLACCFGLYEVDHLRGLASLFPRLLFRTRDRTRWRFAPHAPTPTLLLHGDADRLVPVEQARRLAAQRTALGLPTKLVVYPGARHAFFTRPSPIADRAARELVAHVSSSD